ncbi:MAG: hypothetical protein C0434_05760 [Xanthomonadaceae bacterium]|nr:hypothetical protein [Xanthomonadaceae bacterium]
MAPRRLTPASRALRSEQYLAWMPDRSVVSGCQPPSRALSSTRRRHGDRSVAARNAATSSAPVTLAASKRCSRVKSASL